MGWLWNPFSSGSDDGERALPPANDNTTQSVPTQAPKQGIGLTEEQRLRIFGKPSPPPQSEPVSRDAQADAELEAFLGSLEAPENQTQLAQQGVQQPTTTTSSPSLQADYDRRLPDGSLDISPAALLPRSMSCRQAFDQAFYCQSLGGKFNDVYRYGALRSCSEHWSAFWFCMRTRTLPAREKQRQIVEFHQQREEQKRRKVGSSEDVWELRTRAVDRAFWRDPDAEEDEGGAGGRDGVAVRE